MTAWYRKEKGEPPPPPRRVQGWSEADFSALSRHNRFEVLLTSMERTVAWHQSLWDRRGGIEISWEVEGVVDHYEREVAIATLITCSDSFPSSLAERLKLPPSDVEARYAGYITLNGRVPDAASGRQSEPLLDIHLQPSLFRRVLQAQRISPQDPRSPRRLRCFPERYDGWTYENFVAAMNTGGEVFDWHLPLRSVVTWSHWRFPPPPP